MSEKGAQLDGANAVRFYAAITIVVYHMTMLSKTPFPSGLDFISRHGGHGVPLFYTLSAFALCYGYFGKLESSAELRHFYHRRFWRIAPLFYFMMIVYFVFLWAVFGKIVSVVDIAASLTFTFNLMPGRSEGFVWASWSIGVEMLFYALLPIILIFCASLPRALIFFAITVAISAIWRQEFKDAVGPIKSFANFSIVAYSPYFAAGIAAYFIWREVRWTTMLHRVLIGLAVAGIMVLVWRDIDVLKFYGRSIGWNSANAAVTATWAVVLAAFVLGMSFRRFHLSQCNWTALLGEASFSLYLWHPLIIGVFIRVGAYKAVEAAMGPTYLLFFAMLAMTLAVLIPVALLSHLWIEKRASRYLRDDAVPALTRRYG